MRMITEAKATALSFLEAAQHGRLLEVYREKIAHGFGVDEPVPVLRQQLQDAIRDGDVGDTAVLTINLRRQRAMDWAEAATSMEQANEKAGTLYHAEQEREAARISPLPSWIPDWVPQWVADAPRVLFSPRRWRIEGNIADMEVGAHTADVRAERWKRYASQLQPPTLAP